MESVDWLTGLNEKVFNFVMGMGNDDFTYFKYSLTGDLYDSKTGWGLGQAVFAARILYTIDKLNDVDVAKKNNLIGLIKSFQKDEGYIYDPLITRRAAYSRIKQFLRRRNFDNLKNIQTKRAETRQSFASLYALGSKPDKPFLAIPHSYEGVDKYLSSQDWTKPWGAGSHLGILLFFYRMNRDMFDYKPDLFAQLTDYAIEWVNKLQSRHDGTWYKGDISLSQKINGAMKILLGFSAVDYYKINHVEKIIDTALSGINDTHACDNFNIVYLLYFATKLTDYRKDEIEQFCKLRLNIYKEFYHEQAGGFSFHKNKANDSYYNATITKGLNEPDLHGTAMYMHGIALISDILKIKGPNLNVPLT